MPTPWCSQRCWLKAEPPTRRLHLPSLQSSANTRTEAKRHRRYRKTHFGSSVENVMFDFILFSPDLHFSEPDWLKLSGTACAGCCCGRTLSRSFCTGGALAAWSPKCRRVHGSLPWWKKYVPFQSNSTLHLLGKNFSAGVKPLPSCGRECLLHPSQSGWTSC